MLSNNKEELPKLLNISLENKIDQVYSDNKNITLIFLDKLYKLII